jgi:hypothetical protein
MKNNRVEHGITPWGWLLITAKTLQEIKDQLAFKHFGVPYDHLLIMASQLKVCDEAAELYAQQFKPSGERPDFESISESFADSMVFPDAKNHPIGSRDRSMWETVKEASKRGLVYAYCELSSPSKSESSLNNTTLNSKEGKEVGITPAEHLLSEKNKHIAELRVKEQVLVEALKDAKIFIEGIDDDGEGKGDWKVLIKIKEALSSYNKIT